MRRRRVVAHRSAPVRAPLPVATVLAFGVGAAEATDTNAERVTSRAQAPILGRVLPVSPRDLRGAVSKALYRRAWPSPLVDASIRPPLGQRKVRRLVRLPIVEPFNACSEITFKRLAP